MSLIRLIICALKTKSYPSGLLAARRAAFIDQVRKLTW